VISRILILLSLAFIPGVAWATEETVVQVAQPVFAEGAWYIGLTAYVDMQGSRNPGQNLGLITRPNRMPVRETFEQRNAIFDRGMRITVDDGQNGGLFGDTLRAELDLTNMRRPSESYEEGTEPDLIHKTVDSILITAWFDRFGYNPDRGGLVTAKYLDLRVKGSGTYARYGRVYSFSSEMPRLWRELSGLMP
jgi:hypothetical protein